MTSVTEIDKTKAVIKRVLWYEGNPYDPRGYYALIEFKGETHHVFLAHGDLDAG